VNAGSGRPGYEELAALVVCQAEVIEELRGRVVELEGEVAELRARLSQNSRNSSRPPSSDGYAKPPAPRSVRRPSGRRPGGQAGHEGHHLERVEHPDEVIRYSPARCTRCGSDLADADVVGVRARQVFDLPVVALAVSEHRAEDRRCGCGVVTGAALPGGVAAPAQYGARLRSLALYLIVYQHLPYERAARLLSDCLGATISTGTLHAIVERAGGELDEFCERVRANLLEAPVIHVDETGARSQGRTRWVHSASSQRLTLYRLHDRRGMDGIDHLGVLGHYRGVAVHDGWATYRKYRRPTHALCNVHHLRELQGAIERDPDTQTWAQQMDELLRELKDTVERAKARGESALEAGTLEAYPRRYEQVIALGHRQNPPPTQRTGKRGPIGRSMTANLHRRLDEHRDEVLLFAHDFRVPFDNNLAERDLRMIKLQQKISGSWRTITGAQRFLALRSYTSTTRKHGHDLLDALRQIVDRNPWLPAAGET